MPLSVCLIQELESCRGANAAIKKVLAGREEEFERGLMDDMAIFLQICLKEH